MDLTPEKVKPFLDADQWALYRLIWDRFVASQMTSAVFQQTTAEIEANEGLFTATGTVPVFQGFMALYVEGVDDQENGDQEKGLPALSEGEILTLLGLTPK